MVAIFENREININDRDNLKFPSNAKLTYLPFSCNNKGLCGELTVTDEGGAQKKLRVENKNGKVYFTRGWKAFREAKRIKDDVHKISLHKVDGTDQYTITVSQN